MAVENLKAKIEEFKSKGAKVTMEPTPITVGLLAFNRRPPNRARIALIQHN